MFILKRILWSLRRALGLSPTQKLFRDLRTRNVPLGELSALEIFGHTGFLHTVDYARQVSSLEVWEIDPGKEPDLKRNLPHATVKILDSFEELKRAKQKYDLLVVDNPVEMYAGHCEHFEVFPDIFRVARDSSILILNAVPNPWPPPAPGHLARRRSFYKTDRPDDVPFEAMMKIYKGLIEAAGFGLEWHFFRRRTHAMLGFYLVLKMNRSRLGVP